MPALLPPEVGPLFAGALILTSFATSALTAAFGIGGGLALLAVMAAGLPMATVVPVHGIVQLGSNAGRAVVLKDHIDWPAAGWFSAGGLVGAAAGGLMAARAPDDLLKIAVAAFILLMVWGPKPPAIGRGSIALAGGGAFGGVLTMIVGATGPITAALLSARRMAPMPQVATFSACMTAQHLTKGAVFGALGFAFAPWIPLTAAMIATGFLGTIAGAQILKRLPPDRFRQAFQVVMTVVALQLGIAGVWALAR